MADDQVKYSELLVKDEDVFANLIKELGDVKTKISELKTEASGLSGVLKNISTATREQQQATAANAKSVELLAQKTKDLAATKKNLEDATKRFGNLTDEEVGRLDRLATKLKFSSQWQEATAKLVDTTNMSYNEMKATLAVLTNALHTFGTEEKKNSDEAKALENAIERVRDAMKELDDRTKAVAAAEKQMAEEAKKAAKEEEEAYKASQKEAAQRVKTQEDLHNARQKEIEDAFKARDAEMAKMKLTEEEYNSVKQLKAALAGTAQEQISAMQNLEIQNKSYNELYQTYNAIKDVLKAMTEVNTEAGKAMTAQAAKIYDTMNELQKATGKYTLQVGKYRAAFDGLGYSFQQILREAPSALNLNQFFLAISNNIPMFLDQLKAFRDEQKEIKANLAQMTEGTKEYAEQLGKVESVGKKLGKVLISWQSLVLVGLMILRNWDRIVSGITSLFSNLTKEQKMLKAVNEEAASSVGELTAKFVALQNEWKNLKAEDMSSWLEQHKNDWNELGISIDNANDAENLYVRNTSIIQQAIDDRARSIAAMKLATEKYEEAFKKQVDAEQKMESARGVLNKTSQGRDLIAMLERGDGAGYFKTANLLSYDPDFMRSIGGFGKSYNEFSEAVNNYYSARKALNGEIKDLNDEARQLITTFVLPERGKTPKGPKEKEPKDQVADLLTLTRQLEDQIIANIENEYKRLDEEETKRHERFIQDQEKELKKYAENDPRHAIINQMIEEENRTHERKMEEIDEKRYQNLQALTQKRLADEKKAAEEEEKQEKDNAKNKLKAAVDGWAQYKAKMVEEGKTRKQIVEAEVVAEIARLKLMQDLNRDVNGEIMSDEQKAKVQEWINLLEKLQQTGNYGDYKPGQFMGKGGANVTNERKRYSSTTQVVADVLGVDVTENQISDLNTVFDQAKEALNSWMDARKAAADQAKELADDEVSAAENALNREIELRNQGYANDVALREKELADAKANQKKAAEMQKKAQEDALLVNSAMEASSMAVAVANLFKDFPLYAAIPLTAVLLGSFAAAKIQAFQSIRQTKFKEGGVMLLEGGSHESGHDVNLGIGPDGSNLRAEGGEYFAVINKRSSRKYGSQIPAVVNALNSGMFEDRYIKTSDAVGLLPQVIRADNGTAVDLSSLEGGVDALVKQGEQNWTIEGDYRVLRYKNLTRRVKIG